MNRAIANTLIVGSIVLINVANHRLHFGGANRGKTIRGVFTKMWTNPKSGKEFYIVRPEGRGPNQAVFIPKKLAWKVDWGSLRNRDHRGNPLAGASWDIRDVVILVPAWFYDELKNEGKL